MEKIKIGSFFEQKKGTFLFLESFKGEKTETSPFHFSYGLQDYSQNYFIISKAGIKVHQSILRIEDSSSSKWKEFIDDCLNSILRVIPKEDLDGIEKVLLLDECPNEKFKWAGGFYYSARNNQGAIIELYPSKIINAKPFFFPKIKFSNKYSIIKMFLHELGHHKSGYLPQEQREQRAEEYMLIYLKKTYGNWVYFFDLLARIDNFLR